MMPTRTTPQRPQFGKLFGITYHAETAAPIVRPPKILRIGIGVPKGRAVQVFLHKGQWHIRHGVMEKGKLIMKTVFQGGATVNGVLMENTRKAAEKWHNDNKEFAEVSNRPMKLSYFYFTRRVQTEDRGTITETFEPDFEAIEAHGDIPTRIPVRIVSDNPLYQEYAWWSATQLKCHGDGHLAERAVAAGTSADPGWAEAKAAEQKMFLYSPCYKDGCPMAGVDCKPHSTLSVQLEYAMRLGTTAYFSSTGQVTADRLFSSLFDMRESIERLGYSITGAPLDLVLGSFRANHGGKASSQPCVSLELRHEGAEALRALLQNHAWMPIPLDRVPVEPVIIQPAIEAGTYELTSGAIDADFDDEDGTPEPLPAAAATASRQEQIARQLKDKQTAPHAPWTTQEGMVPMMITMRERVGDDAVAAALARHKVDQENVRFDDPAVLALWLDMKALPSVQKDELF